MIQTRPARLTMPVPRPPGGAVPSALTGCGGACRRYQQRADGWPLATYGGAGDDKPPGRPLELGSLAGAGARSLPSARMFRVSTSACRRHFVAGRRLARGLTCTGVLRAAAQGGLAGLRAMNPNPGASATSATRTSHRRPEAIAEKPGAGRQCRGCERAFPQPR